MLRKSFIEFLYEAAHIQRWNEHIRPGGFTELDKQAHKMMIVYVLARHEEDDHGAQIDWRRLIEGGIFEFMQRNVLTDIKPPIFHEMMRIYGKELNAWVFEEIRRRIPDIEPEFMDKMRNYFEDASYSAMEKKLLRAAHYLATKWEFEIIYHFNEGIYGSEDTKALIDNELEDHYDLAAVKKLALNGKSSKFIDLVGQLRFQKRWAQSPRVPETSVMGHVLLVAIMGYFCAVKLGACDERIVGDFLTGLFHDLPEVLTRDIISPVKRSVPGLDELIKKIEERLVAEKILPLLPYSWHEDIIYYTQNEFTNRVKIDGKVVMTTIEEINVKYNHPGFHAIDGTVLKACDNLAAFVEVWLSRRYGITSKHMEEGEAAIRAMYKGKVIGGIDFGSVYEEFTD
ncbi:HD domain-containing protein [Phascolarctobacterium sp.]|uniref:HD domain-containing protein n=1 Tax=Phascolarctobacterium sp. TaxID=2049039 RepID=UPI0038684FAD